MKNNFRSFHFFGDILPAKAFEKKVASKKDTEEVCRILSEECGIKGKKLAIIGEGKVTE